MPKNIPKSTKIDRFKVPDNPYDKLEEKYKYAIELKSRNISYRDIAKYLHVSITTVKSWFETGGLLIPAWNYYSHILDGDRIQRRLKLEQQINEASPDAVATLVAISKGEDKFATASAKVLASSKLLELAGYQPESKSTIEKESEAIVLLRRLIDENEGKIKSKNGGAVQNKRKSRSLDTKAKGNRRSNTLSNK